MLGPESGLQDDPLLQNEPEKLDQLKYHLTAAEAAQRRGITSTFSKVHRQ